MFENCILVKGIKRSTIVDLGRRKYHIIPNDLHDLLTKYDGKSIEHIMQFYDIENQKTISEYFKFLFDNEIIFHTENPNHFPKIDFSNWKTPSLVYQCIIDLKSDYSVINEDLVESLDNLNCKFLQIRIYGNIKTQRLHDLIKKFENSSIIGIDVYLKYKSIEESEALYDLAKTFQRVNNIVIFDSDTNKQLFTHKKHNVNIAYVKQKITNCLSCGVVSPEYFSVNIQAFTESSNFNSCLNQKISIDENGEIKNCPSMKESFGNIKNVSLEEALDKEGFKKYWKITKDKIEGCKDCEFRHICTDCRAYVENPDDKYSKPLKCGYDPHTSKWEEWSTNPLKQKSIEHYGLRQIIK